MYGDEFKRRKEGEQHVELLCPLNEYKLKYIKQFRKEHPNTSTEWFNHRFNYFQSTVSEKIFTEQEVAHFSI